MSLPQRPGKYQPLIDALTSQGSASATYTFAELAAVLGQPLPIEAHAPGWWRQAQRRIAQVLTAAGWQVETTELWRERVTFVRAASADV